MAVEYIQYAVDSDMTNEELKAGLKELCNKLPPGLPATCRDFVDSHWDQIIEDIDMILNDSTKVCKKLHLCPRASWNKLSGQTRNHLEKIVGEIPPECTYG